jgi:uncharacterized membrane protein YhaH (DUF805 family)
MSAKSESSALRKLISFLFSFQGRINRQSYWLFVGSCVFLTVLLEHLAGPPSESGAMAFWLVFLWPCLAVFTKRYHDRDKSGAWVLVPILIPILGFIECGLRPGTVGTNRFGPDPMEKLPLTESITTPAKIRWLLFGGCILALIGCLLSYQLLLNIVFGTLDLSVGAAPLAIATTLLAGGTYLIGRTLNQRSHLEKPAVPAFAKYAVMAVGVLIVIATASSMGLQSVLIAKVQVPLGENPVITKHIGKISSVKIDFTATGGHSSRDGFVFRVVGAKGSGTVTAEVKGINREQKLISGSLLLDSGETYDLFPENTSSK